MMKKLFALLAIFGLLFACCLAEDAVSLDGLMAEIEAEAGEDLKGSTDGIYLFSNPISETFYTTSTANQFRDVEIVNYAALAEKFGGEPTVTCSGGDANVGFTVKFTPIESVVRDTGSISAELIFPAHPEAAAIPRDAAGVHEAVITISWGGLTATVPIRANVIDFTGPQLTGLSGLSDNVSLRVGDKWNVAFRPDPEDWSFPGLYPYCYVGFYEPEGWDNAHYTWNSDTDMTICFSKAGVYNVILSISYVCRDNGMSKIVFHATKDVCVTVTDRTMSEGVILDVDSLYWTTYTSAWSNDSHAVNILNYHELMETWGSSPTVTFSETGGKVFFTGDIFDSYNTSTDRIDGYVLVNMDWEGKDSFIIPPALAGTYESVMTVTWVNQYVQIPVRLTILPNTGTPLHQIGIGNVPDTKELDVNEVWHVVVKPDPADWSHPDMFTRLSFSYDDSIRNAFIVNGMYEYGGDMDFDLVFLKPGQYDLQILMEIFSNTADGIGFVSMTYKDITVTVTEGQSQPLSITEQQAVHEISPDGKSIFIDKPTITGGTAPYTIAYNCYDAQSNPVNYYYSDDDRTAMTPGYNGRFNVFVVVRDSAGGQAQIDTGWLDLTGYGEQPLTVLEQVAVSEISPDGRSIFIDRPTISGGTGKYTVAYNCYDAQSQPVNYYYSDDPRTAMTPGYAGHFCVFVVVSDGNESIIINTGWYDLVE